jgi:RNA-directed DNA polymerase
VPFTGFLPAISKAALKRISRQVRTWRLHRQTGRTAAELARMVNATVRGWTAYYGAFYRSALYSLLHRINTYLLRWLMAKYRRIRTWQTALQAMRAAIRRQPRYFAHWAWVKPEVR